MLLITDEDRDNETPSPDPVYDRVPTLHNQNMRQILQQFSFTLITVINSAVAIGGSGCSLNQDLRCPGGPQLYPNSILFCLYLGIYIIDFVARQGYHAS